MFGNTEQSALDTAAAAEPAAAAGSPGSRAAGVPAGAGRSTEAAASDASVVVGAAGTATVERVPVPAGTQNASASVISAAGSRSTTVGAA